MSFFYDTLCTITLQIYYRFMGLSLKKQIHCKKISHLIKTKNVVLFFALLDLPERSAVLKKKNAFCKFYTPKGTLNTGFFQKKVGISSVYVSNKCLKNIGACSNLPLYGQTLMVACEHEEQAARAIDITSSLYKAFLLGGFYKNQVQTKTVLKALCFAADRKKEIYTKILRLFSLTNIKNLRATAATYCRTVAILEQIGKVQNNPPEYTSGK